MTVLAALKKNDGIPSLNGWPLCAELMLLQLQHQIIHANRKWEADGRWSLGEEESIVCETVSHAQGHTHNHTQTDTHACVGSVCRDCIIRPVGAGAVCVKTLTVDPVQHASGLEGSVEGIRGLHAMRHGVLEEALPYYTQANQSQVRVGLTQP